GGRAVAARGSTNGGALLDSSQGRTGVSPPFAAADGHPAALRVHQYADRAALWAGLRGAGEGCLRLVASAGLDAGRGRTRRGRELGDLQLARGRVVAAADGRA